MAAGCADLPAAARQREGNAAFTAGDYEAAAACYTAALQLLQHGAGGARAPGPVTVAPVGSPGGHPGTAPPATVTPDAATLLSNRSAARLMQGHANGSLEDARAAAAAKPLWSKPPYREGAALRALGQPAAAAAAFRRALQLEPGLMAAAEQLAAAEADAAAACAGPILRGHTEGVFTLAYRPPHGAADSDGGSALPVLATASFDGTARLWCGRTGRPLASLAAHDDKVTALAWGPAVAAAAGGGGAGLGLGLRVAASGGGPSERWLATGSLDHTCVLWAISNEIGGGGGDATDEPGEPPVVAFSAMAAAQPSGPPAAAAPVPVPASESGPGSAAARAVHRLSGHDGRVTAVSFGPAGSNWVATASTDKTAAVWSLLTGARLHSLGPHGGIVPSLAVSPGAGRLLATAGGDGRLRLWCTQTGNCLREADWKASGGVTAVLFAPPGALAPRGTHVLLSCHTQAQTEEGRVIAWALPGDDPGGATPGRGGPDLAALATKLQAPAAGRSTQLATPAEYRLGPGALAAPLRSFPSATSPYRGGVVHASLAEGPEGPLLAVACADGSVAVADAASGTALLRLERPHAIPTPYGPNGTLYQAALSPSGEYLATSGIDHCVRVWAAETGEALACLSGHTDAVRGLAWSPAGDSLASASLDGSARVWAATWARAAGGI